MAKKKRKLSKKEKAINRWDFPKEVHVYSDDDDIDGPDGDRYFNVETTRDAVANDLPPNRTRRVATYRLVHEGEITNEPTYNAVRAYDPDENRG